MQAQHLAATLALYNLVKGQVLLHVDIAQPGPALLLQCLQCRLSLSQSVHQLLPPTYRDVWLEWRDSEQQRQEESRTAANKPRDQFISRLLTRLKQQQNQNQGKGPGSQSQDGPGQGEDEEPEESWENLAGLDIEDGGEEAEDKNDKRGGKKEGAGALQASRELLLKLKKSSLAHKLQVNTLYHPHIL